MIMAILLNRNSHGAQSFHLVRVETESVEAFKPPLIPGYGSMEVIKVFSINDLDSGDVEGFKTLQKMTFKGCHFDILLGRIFSSAIEEAIEIGRTGKW